MTQKLKLITESNYNLEIAESTDKKDLYIMGIFSSAETRNENGRVYPKNILEREIEKIQEAVKRKTCLGQLEHPTDSPETMLEKAAIMVEDVKWKGHDVYGKAKVLTTPHGQILRNLINDGATIGISSRGLGEVSESGHVKESYRLLTWDCVANPSNQTSWVQGIYEGKEFTIPEYGVSEPTEDEIKAVLKEHEQKIWQVLKSFRG